MIRIYLRKIDYVPRFSRVRDVGYVIHDSDRIGTNHRTDGIRPFYVMTIEMSVF